MMGALFPDWSDPAAHFEGSHTEEGTITGGITGFFEGDTSFACAFEGSFEFTQEVQVFYEGRITGPEPSSPRGPTSISRFSHPGKASTSPPGDRYRPSREHWVSSADVSSPSPPLQEVQNARAAERRSAGAP